MLNKPPTQQQESDWLSMVASHGCVILSPRAGAPITRGIQLHHPGGREMKQNKLYIGRWFVIPLAWRYHDVHSDDPIHVDKHKEAFISEFGKQSQLFKTMCDNLVSRGYTLPFGDDVMQAIMDTGI